MATIGNPINNLTEEEKEKLAAASSAAAEDVKSVRRAAEEAKQREEFMFITQQSFDEAMLKLQQDSMIALQLAKQELADIQKRHEAEMRFVYDRLEQKRWDRPAASQFISNEIVSSRELLISPMATRHHVTSSAEQIEAARQQQFDIEQDTAMERELMRMRYAAELDAERYERFRQQQEEQDRSLRYAEQDRRLASLLRTNSSHGYSQMTYQDEEVQDEDDEEDEWQGQQSYASSAVRAPATYDASTDSASLHMLITAGDQSWESNDFKTFSIRTSTTRDASSSRIDESLEVRATYHDAQGEKESDEEEGERDGAAAAVRVAEAESEQKSATAQLNYFGAAENGRESNYFSEEDYDTYDAYDDRGERSDGSYSGDERSGGSEHFPDDDEYGEVILYSEHTTSYGGW